MPEQQSYQLGSNGLGNVEMLNFDGAVQSAVLGAGVRAVRLFATARCHIKIAASPTASATTTDSAARDFILESGVYVPFAIPTGTDPTSLKIGAIKFAGGVAGILQIERYT
jgi:hypothetical protein